jgi:septal ring factor EnvC (AmiA/AmiB activator)
MNKAYLFIAFMAFVNISLAQKENINVESSVQDLKTEISRINNQLGDLSKDLVSIGSTSKQNEKNISQIQKSIKILSNNVNAINRSLDIKITQTGKRNEDQIDELGGDLERSRLYWIIASLSILVLGFVMYIFISKRIKSSQTDVEGQIRNTKKSLEEEGLKLDNKLIEVLETQLKVHREESNNRPIATNEKLDHSLALKVADEIVRMQKNISRMDSEIKGLKPLEKGIERIQANFAANGYEMVNLLNIEFDERMNIDVINFIVDENLESGKKVISKIIKPQVNFNGELIQKAQVDVSQN